LEHWIIFGTLILTLVLFISGRWRYDMVALLALLILDADRLDPSRTSFLRFQQPGGHNGGSRAGCQPGTAKLGGSGPDRAATGALKGGVTVQLAALTGLIMVLSAL
jgi:hypothetical protein